MRRALRGRFEYIHSCPNSTFEDIQALIDSEKSITLRTFREAVGRRNWNALTKALGYDRYTPISRAWNVGYFKGFYRGVPAVFVRWSAMEYIFTLDGRLGPSLAR